MQTATLNLDGGNKIHKGFIISQKSDMDKTKAFKVLKGNLTRCRYKMLDRFCRKLTQSINCGHDYDCCGCLCSRDVSFTHNPVTKKTLIVFVEHFNY